jgi:hypothetical protein
MAHTGSDPVASRGAGADAIGAQQVIRPPEQQRKRRRSSTGAAGAAAGAGGTGGAAAAAAGEGVGAEQSAQKQQPGKKRRRRRKPPEQLYAEKCEAARLLLAGKRRRRSAEAEDKKALERRREMVKELEKLPLRPLRKKRALEGKRGAPVTAKRKGQSYPPSRKMRQSHLPGAGMKMPAAATGGGVQGARAQQRSRANKQVIAHLNVGFINKTLLG